MIFWFLQRRLAISGAYDNAPLSERAEISDFRTPCGIEFRAILGTREGIFRVRPVQKPESGSKLRKDWFECRIGAP